MDIRQLRYFLAVAKHLHFGNAAKSLHMAQPPLSQAVRGLEKSLGYSLFERNSRNVSLTPGGQALVDEAARLVGEFDRFYKFARDLDPVPQRDLHIGFGGPSSMSAMPALAAKLRETQPHVEVHFHPVFGSPALDRLIKGELDLAFTRCPLDRAVFDFHIFDYDRLVAVVPVGHALADSTSIELVRLIRLPFVSFESDAATNTRAICEEAARHQGVHFEPTGAPDIQAMLGLIAAEVGVGVVPESALALRVEGVEAVELSYRYTHLASALAWRRDDRSPLLHEVKSMLQLTFPGGDAPESGVYGVTD